MKWDNISLGEVIDVKHGYPFKSEFFSDTGDLILLSPGNCHEAGGLKLKGDKEKYYIGEYPEEYLLSEGEIIVVMTDLINTAPILGGAFLIPESNRFLHNQRLGLVHVTNEKRIDRGFLLYLLNSSEYRGQIRGSASGATVRHTAPNRIKECRLRIPKDISYQKKVGDLLSAYDDLIDNNRRRMALLEDSARQLYREWFVRLRFPGHEHTPIVDSVPQGWRKVSLAEITSKIGSGATPKGGEAAYQPEGVTLIRSMNVYDDLFDDAGLAFLNDEQAAGLGNVVVEPNDILLNITGASVARCCMAPERYLPARVNQHVMIIRVNPKKANPFFVHKAINSDECKRLLLSFARKGSTREALTKEEMANFEITIPTSALMEQFGEIAADAYAQREVLAKQN